MNFETFTPAPQGAPGSLVSEAHPGASAPASRLDADAAAAPADDGEAAMRAAFHELRHGQPVRGTGVLPLWQRLTGLIPGGQSREDRRASLGKLVCLVVLWFRAEMGLEDGGFAPVSGGLESAPEPVPECGSAPAVRASCYADPGGRAGPLKLKVDVRQRPLALLHEPAAARGSAWEPSHELAERLELPESTLNRLCRETSGRTAREWWDYLRAESYSAGIRAEIFALLKDETFPTPGYKWDPQSMAEIGLHGLQRRLSARRRAQGWSRQGAAWRAGFKNRARLERAVFDATGSTIAELESAVVVEICETWILNRAMSRIYPPDVELTPDEMRARGANFLRLGMNDQRTGYPCAVVPELTALVPAGPAAPGAAVRLVPPRAVINSQYTGPQEFQNWDSLVQWCAEYSLDIRKVIVRTLRGRGAGREMLAYLGFDTAEYWDIDNSTFHIPVDGMIEDFDAADARPVAAGPSADAVATLADDAPSAGQGGSLLEF